MSLVKGTKLGCYEIRTQRGAVAMGEGYRPATRCWTASLPTRLRTPNSPNAFAREARAVHMVGHPEHDAGPETGF